MASVEEIIKHKEKLEKLKSAHEAAVGAQNALLAQLKEQYGCDTIEAAGDKLTEMKSALVDEEVKLETMAAEWEEKYSSLLNLA